MRRILCEPCNEKRGPGLHPEDAANGFQRRAVHLRAKKPAELYVDTKTVEAGHLTIERRHFDKLHCDDCGRPIPDGARIVALSIWRDGELTPWEREYGDIQP